MPFPKLKYCLVCDNAREETLGKITLLGFVGISPDVQIFITPPQPGVVNALQLSFVFVGGPGDGAYTLSYQLYDVEKNSIMGTISSGQPTPVPTHPPSVANWNTNFIINVMMPVPHFGAYELRLLVDGILNYTAHFRVAERTAAIAAAQAAPAPV